MVTETDLGIFEASEPHVADVKVDGPMTHVCSAWPAVDIRVLSNRFLSGLERFSPPEVTVHAGLPDPAWRDYY